MVFRTRSFLSQYVVVGANKNNNTFNYNHNHNMYNSTRLAEVAAISYLASRVHTSRRFITSTSPLTTSTPANASPHAVKPSSFSPPNSERQPPPPQASWDPYNPAPVALTILTSRHGSFPTAWRMVVAEQQACKYILFKSGVVDMALQVEDALKFKIMKHFDVVGRAVESLPNFPFAPLKDGMNLAVGVASAVADLAVNAAGATFNWALRKAIRWEWGVVVSFMIGGLCGIYGVVNFFSVFTLGDEGTGIKITEVNDNKVHKARYSDTRVALVEPPKPEEIAEDNNTFDAEEYILSDPETLSDSRSCESFSDVSSAEVLGPIQSVALPSEAAEQGPQDLSHITVDLDFCDGPTIGSILANWDECVDSGRDVETAASGSEVSFVIDTIKVLDQECEGIMLEGAMIFLFGSDTEESDVEYEDEVSSDDVEADVTDEALESEEEMDSSRGYEYEMDKNGKRRLEALMSDVKLDLTSFVNKHDSCVAETGCIRESKSSPAILADRELICCDSKDEPDDEEHDLTMDHVQDVIDELPIILVSCDLESKSCVVAEQPVDFEIEVPAAVICSISSENTKTPSLLTPDAPAFVPRAFQAKDKMPVKPSFQFNAQSAPTFVPRNSSPNPLSPAPRLHLQSRLFTVSLPSPGPSKAAVSSSVASTSKTLPTFQPRTLAPAFVPSSLQAPSRGDNWTDFTLLHDDGLAEKLRKQGPPPFWAPPVSPSPSEAPGLEKPKKKRRKRNRRRNKNKNKNQATTGEDGAGAHEDDDDCDDEEDLELEAYFEAEEEVDRPEISA